MRKFLIIASLVAILWSCSSYVRFTSDDLDDIKTFGNLDCPVLLMSDTEDMKSFIKFEAGLLQKLVKTNELQQFISRIHSFVEHGASLGDIQKKLVSKKLVSGLKTAYDEVKSLVSFNFSAKTDV